MVRIAVLASFNMDLVMRAERSPLPGETLQGDFAMHLGGKGFNQAIAARRLGADVAVVGRVGDDEFGRLFLEALDREGIDARGVAIDREHGTGVAVITVTPDGENAIIQAPRANLAVTQADILKAEGSYLIESEVDFIPPFDAPKILRASDLALVTLETSEASVGFFVEAAFEVGCPVILNAAPASRVRGDATGLSMSDLLVVNRMEAEALSGKTCATIDEAMALAKTLHRRRTTVITLGAGGAVAGATTHVPGFPVHAVDTTGAGDAFCAALAVRLAEGAGLPDAVRFACAAGAVACTRHGAEPSMPQRHEVEALLKREGYG
jgi:ribokinase